MNIKGLDKAQIKILFLIAFTFFVGFCLYQQNVENKKELKIELLSTHERFLSSLLNDFETLVEKEKRTLDVNVKAINMNILEHGDVGYVFYKLNRRNSYSRYSKDFERFSTVMYKHIGDGDYIKFTYKGIISDFLELTTSAPEMSKEVFSTRDAASGIISEPNNQLIALEMTREKSLNQIYKMPVDIGACFNLKSCNESSKKILNYKEIMADIISHSLSFHLPIDEVIKIKISELKEQFVQNK